jgi:CRISPR-associated endonuclease/helicase Cas3
MEMDDQLSVGFRALTKDSDGNGYEPLHWQRRLFERFRQNDIPTTCDLPTGLGKTSVIHLWLLALMNQIRENKPRLPTRLVYVVDRRTVVDQATEIANRIKANVRLLDLGENLVSVSALRGHLADNRQWSIDPSRPAIIIGTVDMIGSRLLFSGYRSSYKRRPLEAGLLGRDALLVLDEAHLSKPFANLTRSIEERNDGSLFVMHMSATSTDRGPEAPLAREKTRSQFTLVPSDLEGTRDTNQIVRRFEAVKRLTIHEGVTDVHAKMVGLAADLAKDHSRVVVFLRSPDDAMKLKAALVKYGAKKEKPYSASVEILTGTMRGWERDELVKKPVMRRFLDPTNRPAEGPAILVSTSAGEVGFDLNADHLVCDAAPLDSIIQRFGRVNRRGDSAAEVHLVVGAAKEAKKKPGKDTGPNRYEIAWKATVELLKEHLRGAGGDPTGAVYDVSPKALAALPKPENALAPTPAIVELTDILLDAWSMTSIVEPMPGRPPVGPWLRGIDSDEPQTSIAWRSELGVDGFDRLRSDDIEEWFDAHRILSHEVLSVPTYKAAEWIVERWEALPGEVREAVGERSCVVDRAGLRIVKLQDLVDELKRKRTESIVHADIILPAAFGGIETGKGLLDRTKPSEAESEALASRSPLTAPDVADNMGNRHRLIRTSSDDSDNTMPLIGAMPVNETGFVRFEIDLPSDGDLRRQLVSLVARRDRPDFSTDRQTLAQHVDLVEKQASNIAAMVPLSDAERAAVKLGAGWHDKGKDRGIWQRAVGRKPDEEPVGKSGSSMRRVAGDYRHEFGSLREFIDEHEGKIDSDVFDLAMHLIAAHHGRGRPHFARGGFDPCARARSPEIATEVIRRFGRLQHRYGHWRLASLENLLRCADAAASARRENR